jgi:hypothetical protein
MTNQKIKQPFAQMRERGLEQLFVFIQQLPQQNIPLFLTLQKNKNSNRNSCPKKLTPKSSLLVRDTPNNFPEGSSAVWGDFHCRKNQSARYSISYLF